MKQIVPDTELLDLSSEEIIETVDDHFDNEDFD